MILTLTSLGIVLLATNLWVLFRYLDYRSKLKQRGFMASWPIPLILLDQLDSSFSTNEFGPTLSTQVKFIGKGNLTVFGGTSDSEAWILSVLAKRAMNIFEFGTCTGGTRQTKDVFKSLNQLSKKLPLVHIKGTSLVAYRKSR
jgi:hypothetical protein